MVFHLGQVEKVPIHQVASDWAVTAAHCLVDRRPSEMILQLGNEFSVDADDTAGNATFRWDGSPFISVQAFGDSSPSGIQRGEQLVF